MIAVRFHGHEKRSMVDSVEGVDKVNVRRYKWPVALSAVVIKDKKSFCK
jgi:hypothetical protein